MGRGDLRRIKEKFDLPSFKVSHEGTEGPIEGISPLRFVHQMMDIKAMTNTSDIGMEMIIKYVTT